MSISIETFFLPTGAQGTLQSQIQGLIAGGILSGRYKKGEKLPSSRKLAMHLGVSRLTVSLALTELVANDYLTARGRSGYFVSETAPVPPSFAPNAQMNECVNWDERFTRTFTHSASPLRPRNWRDYEFPFIYGQADPTLFDHTNWRQCALRALGHKDFASMTGDHYDEDDPLLLEYIARHTLPRRGILARPEEILLTMGAQNALWLVSQLLLEGGKKAAIEDPCYYVQRSQLEHTGCALDVISIDADGLPPDQIAPDTDVVFTTPSHHSPSSVTMPMARRKQLLDRAKQIGALVVEDDYEFEMSARGNPSPALKSIDEDGRVLYIGSFSKSLFPGLRLGYLVGSEPFIRQARALRSSVLRHPPGHIQRTVAYFLSLGHYDAQIRKTADVLRERRAILLHAIAESGLEFAETSGLGGSSVWMRAADHIDMQEIASDLQRDGVLIEPGSAFFAPQNRRQNYYRLGYSSIRSAKIQQGIRHIASRIEQT